MSLLCWFDHGQPTNAKKMMRMMIGVENTAIGLMSCVWLTPEAEADLMKAQVLKEKVYPADIARMALFLAADDSRLISGQTFVVDGGRM